MSEHSEGVQVAAPHTAGTGEHKTTSPAPFEKGGRTPAGVGDVTPTQSRSTSPVRMTKSTLPSGSSTTETETLSAAVTNGASVDRPEPNVVANILHAHSSPDTGQTCLSTSNVYDALLPSSHRSPFPSRSLTPKYRLAAPAADGRPEEKDMSSTSPRPGPSSGPVPARRQQQPRGQRPYGYHPSPSASESNFPRNPPSISSQGAPPSFAHMQQPAAPQRSASFTGQYTMSPPPASLYPQHQHQQYTYPPQLTIPGMPPMAHTHSTPDFFPLGHSVSPSQPPLFAPSFNTSVHPEHASTPGLALDYDGGNAGRNLAPGAGSPYTQHHPFASFNYHSTPQFTHSHSPFSSPFQAHQAQHPQRPQYPPSFAYVTRTNPTASEDAVQQHPPATWWYVTPHSASPTTGPYPNVYYLDAYGNPSNAGLGLGPGFPSSISSTATGPLQQPVFALPDSAVGSGTGTGLGSSLGRITGGPQRPNGDPSKPESGTSSSRAPLSPPPIALGESVSERGQQQQLQSKQSNRRSYLPNPPVQRSEWVMWVGNVPTDAAHDELWRFFTRPITPSSTSPVDVRSPNRQQMHQPPHLPAGLLSPSGSSSASDTNVAEVSGVASVFLIARSNCAFVNYRSAEHLSAAVRRFNGVPLRSMDPRCPRLVCRVRGKDEDLRAGVGGQRGTGIHTRWIREQHEREKVREQENWAGRKEGLTAEGETSASEPPDTPSSVVQTESGRDSPGHDAHPIRRPPHHSSSSGSTTSGFLARYFPKRYFILKSLTQYDLDLSVEKGIWATQPHNETILNQAFRNSSDVYLIFGVNKSGEFFGYARMASLIGKAADDRVSWASRTDSQHSHSPAISLASSVAGKGSQVNETIMEENEGSSPEGKEGDNAKEKKRERERERRSFILFSPSEHRLAEGSPQPVTPTTQKRLSKAEETDSGKVPLSDEASTAPPSDRHHDKLKTLMPKDHVARSPLRPSSPPTSAPAVMGPSYRKITIPRTEGLSSETMDPRLLRHRPPSVQLDPEAPLRAMRDQETRHSRDEKPLDDSDRVKRKDTLNLSSSASGSGSKLREILRADKPLSLTKQNQDVGPDDAGRNPRAQTQTQSEAQIQPEREDLPAQWGSPFKVQWIRVASLPFHRTRNLRNPWNHDREVKVSRDGTELEPTVGQALLDEWDKEEPPPATLGTGGGAGPSSPVVSRRGGQYRTMQSHALNSVIEGEAGPRPGSPHVFQQKQSPR